MSTVLNFNSLDELVAQQTSIVARYKLLDSPTPFTKGAILALLIADTLGFHRFLSFAGQSSETRARQAASVGQISTFSRWGRT